MRHLLDTTCLSDLEVREVLKDAKHYLLNNDDILAGKIITLMFYENSTRTQSSFESAIIRLGGHALRLDVARSSASKGEDLKESAKNLAAMKPCAIIMRHKKSGAPHALSRHINVPLINAGDGKHAHPSQALLDLFTIMEYFKGDIRGKKIAIVGDIINSRVANSNIELLSRFGMDITLVGPEHFLPKRGLKTSNNLVKSINCADVVMSLRTQTERQDSEVYASLDDYANDFCIKKEHFHGKIPLILHPGPVHKDIDIESKLMNDENSHILKQVENGVAIRMALLKKFALR